MTQITLDTILSEQLKAAGDNVQFVDEDGNVVGTYHREISPPYDPQLIPEISNEELTRREQEAGAMSTADVLKHLECL